MKKSLIHTNPNTNETRWCVADVVCDLTIEQYINVVDLGFREDELHCPENFKWVEQPEEVSMHTHIYKDGEFVLSTTEPESSIQNFNSH